MVDEPLDAPRTYGTEHPPGVPETVGVGDRFAFAIKDIRLQGVSVMDRVERIDFVKGEMNALGWALS